MDNNCEVCYEEGGLRGDGWVQTNIKKMAVTFEQDTILYKTSAWIFSASVSKHHHMVIISIVGGTIFRGLMGGTILANVIYD